MKFRGNKNHFYLNTEKEHKIMLSHNFVFFNPIKKLYVQNTYSLIFILFNLSIYNVFHHFGLTFRTSSIGHKTTIQNALLLNFLLTTPVHSFSNTLCMFIAIFYSHILNLSRANSKFFHFYLTISQLLK